MIEFGFYEDENIPFCEFVAPNGRRFDVVLAPDREGIRFANALSRVLEASSEEIPGDIWPLDPEEA